MQKAHVSRRKRFAGAVCLLLLIVLIYAAMCYTSGVHPSAYQHRSYLHQARAWLQGETALPRNYEYLELAEYGGRYYVSFPPVPSVPMLLFTLIWGEDVPGGLILKIYTAIACMVVFSEICRTKRMPLYESIAWAFLLCFACAMLPVTLVSGVWYEAQVLAFLFAVCAIAALRRGRISFACICYALGVGCRPFTVLLGPVLLAMYIEENRRLQIPVRRAFIRLLPGLCIGLMIAAAYGWYNWIRFGDPFEFGHNYLPEFTNARYGQFSLRYAAQNWKTLFFGSPFTLQDGKLTTYEFGFSMFLSCPILICSLVWLAQDIVKRRMTPVKIIILLAGIMNVFLLLMHRTLGGHQFGMRYALELLPLCLCWYLLSHERKKLSLWEFALLMFGLVFNFFGGCMVHI